MGSSSIPRTVSGLALALALSVIGQAQDAPAGGQQAPPQAPSPAGPGQGQQPPGGIGTQQPGRPDRQPMDPRQQPQQPFPEMPRAIYLSGKVVMDDGTPPPDNVVIERVCNGQPRPEGYTDSKGRFSFQLGQNSAMMMDASVSSAATDFPGRAGQGQFGGMPGRSGISERDLMGCELRASLPGFRSDIVNLSGRRTMDNPDVGTIVLHRLAKVDGFTFSGTTMFAPKDAKKAFDKGKQQVKKKKLNEAEKEFQKAVGLYPKFAVAWYELGLVQQQQNKLAEARTSYQESLKADAKFISPYGMLARLAVAENKWEEVANHTAELIKLNPYASPEAYFYSAVANFQLQKLDPAEEHAREAVKKSNNPKIKHLLGLILAQKGQFGEAAENMRAYLTAVPDAKDADQVKQQLAHVEKLLNERTAGAQQAQ